MCHFQPAVVESRLEVRPPGWSIVAAWWWRGLGPTAGVRPEAPGVRLEASGVRLEALGVLSGSSML